MSEENILVVDDKPENLSLLLEVLKRESYKVRCALKPPMALKAIQALKPDLILLDVSMPEMTGYELCKVIKQNPNHADIPIVFVSAYNESVDRAKAFAIGGVDYITKPIEVVEVLARIRNHLTLQALKRENCALRAAIDQLQSAR
ncbi:MAG: response regulator [Cyanobacteria bacterium J06642_2]